MPHGESPDEPQVPQAPSPGLAGGPGPTPPGVDDGTPRLVHEGSVEPAPSPAAQERAGRVAEQSAGTRQAGEREGEGEGTAAARREEEPER